MTVASSMAALGALAMAVVLAVLRLGLVGPVAAAANDALIPLLTAVGCLCVVALARRSHSSIAWLATIGAASVVTLDLAAYARDVRPLVSEEAWRWLGIAVSLGALLAAGSAVAYAASRVRLRHRWLAAAGIAAVGALAAVAGWAVANPTDTTFVAGSALGSLGMVTRLFLVITTVFTGIGVIGDLLPAADRARRRVDTGAERTGSSGERVLVWLRAFGDELSPGRLRARRAVLAERSRVARDIHADVVPGLRKALADAERGAPADRLAASLRDVLADVEAVGTVQHPIQLEIGGLVAALEWLAERVESRSDVRITMNIADPGGGTSSEPPAEVAAAAFRIAAVALDNVVRHAPGTNVLVDVRAEARLVDLSIIDDGPGIADAAVVKARAEGRRGLADMAAEATESGGALEITVGPMSVGTCIRFAWPTPAGR